MKKSVIFLIIAFMTAIILISISTNLIKKDEDYEGELLSTKIDLSLKVASKPLLDIISPKNETYQNTQIYLNYTAQYADSLWYNLDNSGDITITSPLYFNVAEGSHTLYLYANNSEGLTMKNVAFSVNLTEETPIETPSQPSGGGGGGGGGIISEKPAPIKINFGIDKEIIKISLRKQEIKKETILIKNIGARKLNLTLSLSPEIQDFVAVKEKTFELSIGETKEIALDFTAKDITSPALYIGDLTAQADSLRKRVLIVVEIIPEQILFNIELKIPEKYSIISPGEKILADVKIFNLEKIKIAEKIKMKIDYIIKNENNKILSIETEERIVETEARFGREFKISEDAEFGTYILYAIAKYEESGAISSDDFYIGEKALLKPSIYRIYIVSLLIFLMLLILLIILYILGRKIKKEMKKSKRN